MPEMQFITRLLIAFMILWIITIIYAIRFYLKLRKKEKDDKTICKDTNESPESTKRRNSTDKCDPNA